MTEPLAPQYNPSAIESALYAWWRERGLFSPAGTGRPYVVMMPPPNVTAALHMGHGLNNTVQDVLVRFERMRGRRVLWVPGTDHAGIATQNVVERLLAKEGLTRFDVGREAFVERVWSYVRETGAAILEQLEAIGCLRRLDPHLLHAGRGPLARRARGVRHALRGGTRLPRPLHHQLVPALPHRPLQRGSGKGRDGREDLASPLPARRRERARHRGHHASGDDAGRHRGRRAPRGRALPRPDRSRAPAAGGASAGAHRGRRCRGPGLRVRGREGDAGARSGRLRDRPPPRPPLHRRHDARGTDQPRGARPVPGPRPLRRAEPRGGGVRGGGPAREGRAAPPRRGPLLPLRHRGRAAALRSVVRAHGAAGPPGARAVSRRDPPLRPRASGRRLRPVDGEHPRLVHLAAALVGPPHPGLVLRSERCGAHHGEPDRRRRLPCLRRPGAAGRGRARHLVLLVARAVLDPRLARAHAGSRARSIRATPWCRRPRSSSSGSRG